MMKPTVALILSVIAADVAVAQSFAFDTLQGRWSGKGTFRGAPADVTAAVEPVFGGRFWTLTIKTAVAGPQPFTFEGRATYPVKQGTPSQGYWIDSNGTSYAISPSVDGGMLAALWGNERYKGRSTYKLDESGRLRIDDFVQNKSGEWQQFATTTLDRQK